MPTDIYFGGEHVRVRVDQEPGQVAESFASAHGLPFRLTGEGGREVYVNPSTVAFWLASEPHQGFESSEPPQEPEEPSGQRQVVTNLWGQPVRRKPRR